jgi:hypothetical protein
MRARIIIFVRRCTAWAVCLAALGAVTTVALRTVETESPGAFPGGDARFAAILPAGAEQAPVIQASATSAPRLTPAEALVERPDHAGGDAD